MWLSDQACAGKVKVLRDFPRMDVTVEKLIFISVDFFVFSNGPIMGYSVALYLLGFAFAACLASFPKVGCNSICWSLFSLQN